MTRSRAVRVIFSQQATSLLLVVAVLLLAYVTLHTRDVVTNRTIVVQQDQATRAAEVRAREEAVAAAKLAKDTASDLLLQVTLDGSKRDAHLTALVARMQANLTDAITRLEQAVAALQRTLDKYAREDARRDRRRNSVPAPTPAPTPCVPVVTCK